MFTEALKRQWPGNEVLRAKVFLRTRAQVKFKLPTIFLSLVRVKIVDMIVHYPKWMDTCLQNFQATYLFVDEMTYIWERLMKLYNKKTFVSNTFLYKNNVKYFSITYPLRNNVCL